MELGLLLALMTGRFKGHLNCSVCDKRQLSRLDCHLANIHGISEKELSRMLVAAKEECLIHKLADLRAHGPEHHLCEPENQPEASTSALGPSPKGRTPKVSRRFTNSMVGKVLQNFQEFYTSSKPTNKNRENARLRKSHATWFVLDISLPVRQEPVLQVEHKTQGCMALLFLDIYSFT
ncbi:hypothetical protein MHYP_G00111110 [Metynnis hypsauchen]